MTHILSLVERSSNTPTVQARFGVVPPGTAFPGVLTRDVRNVGTEPYSSLAVVMQPIAGSDLNLWATAIVRHMRGVTTLSTVNLSSALLSNTFLNFQPADRLELDLDVSVPVGGQLSTADLSSVIVFDGVRG